MSDAYEEDDPAGIMYGSEADPIVAEFDACLTGSAKNEVSPTGFTDEIEAADAGVYATQIASAMLTATDRYSDFRTSDVGQ